MITTGRMRPHLSMPKSMMPTNTKTRPGVVRPASTKSQKKASQ